MPRTIRRSPSRTSALTPNQQQRRTRILDATRELVTRHGYDGMIMRDVAALAEVSATTLYNLYNTKDELLLEALRERITDATDHAVRQSDGPGYVFLLSHLSSVCKETRKSPAYVSAIAQTLFRASPGDPLVQVLLDDFRETTLHSLGAMLDRAQLKPDVQPEALAAALVGSFWSVFLLWDKGLLELAELEGAQLRGYLCVLIAATRGATRLDLEQRYDAINSSNLKVPPQHSRTAR